MAVEKVHIDQFLKLAENYHVLDVRSPGEYRHAHIPGAYNLPLFSDEERKIVGTTYKQVSREAAIKTGLEYFGPKMRKMVEEVEEISNREAGIRNGIEYLNPNSKTLLIHCWRGGMRSAGVAWLLDLYGFKVYTLTGGYKKFRHWVLDTFSKPFSFKILGGYTGSGKTYLLKELEKQGETIVDLEEIACHKGSAFGAVDHSTQPSQEMFENILAQELHRKSMVNCEWSMKEDTLTYSPSLYYSQIIWLEDESQRIGNLNIPQPLWNTMRRSPVEFLEIPFEKRLENIIMEYGKLDKQKMAESIIRIQKRLGGLETKTALEFLKQDNIKQCFSILLKYYDKWYLKGLTNRNDMPVLLNRIPCQGVNIVPNIQHLLKKEVAVNG